MEACFVACGGPSDHPTTTFSFPTGSVTARSVPSPSPSSTLASIRGLTTASTFDQSTRRSLVFSTSINVPSASLCSLPLEVGSCNSFTTRYYFDRINQKCRQFRYGGCGGNGNNFKTADKCQKNCGVTEGRRQGPTSNNITAKIALSKTTKTSSLSTTSHDEHQSREFQTNETGLRKRKMKRVRISPKEGHNTKARGGSRFNSQELQERSLLLDSNDADNDDRDSVLDQAETRAVLNRARLRARSSSTDSSSITSS